MFKNRRSQKPSDDLYKSFKAKFPQMNRSSIDGDPSSSVARDAQFASTSLADTALDIHTEPRAVDDLKNVDSTPRSNEPWSFGASGLTPSIMDPNSSSFDLLANQLPDYYTPTSGGMPLYHHQAGDLHTPNYGLGLGTPLSMPTSEGPVPAGELGATFQNYQNHASQHLDQAPFDNVNPFHMQHVTSFPPHHFSHQNTFSTVDEKHHEGPTGNISMHMDLKQAEGHFRTPAPRNAMQPPSTFPNEEQFRYHATLNAPTAMVKHADEIPITYLNKGQVYTLNVVDTHVRQTTTLNRYRTFVRVSFEDDQQRAKPAGCWQLWKEGRGTNEAHQRGGRLQAVEFVEPSQMSSVEDPMRPKVELQNASFDGFCVTWSTVSNAAECSIAVRFNFLSTDFSHSKGVKGIPVRLCAKTELLPDVAHDATDSRNDEVCYCKVKLFRDHGAERKLSNDVSHVRKMIEKFNQQIVQVESGVRDLGKRKRGIFARSTDERPSKLSKHRRTWSLSSLTPSSGRQSAEEELHLKLIGLQDMFSSTRPASVLHLRGAAEDDPDLFPVKLSTETESLIRHDSGDTGWDQRSTSSLHSPTPSNNSTSRSRRSSTIQPARGSSHSRRDSTILQTNPHDTAVRHGDGDWQNRAQTATADLVDAITVEPVDISSVPITSKVRRGSTTTSNASWIDALDVEPGYQPPVERVVKPVACIYIKSREETVYRAVYLRQRTIKDFVNAIALKRDIEPTLVAQVMHITRHKLTVLFDDECVRELREGQDMTVEFAKVQDERKAVPQWRPHDMTLQVDGELTTLENTASDAFELRLIF